MGKQTNKSGSKFGGRWTKEKLHIIEDYLYFYVRALSKINVKLYNLKIVKERLIDED